MIVWALVTKAYLGLDVNKDKNWLGVGSPIQKNELKGWHKLVTDLFVVCYIPEFILSYDGKKN